MTTQRVLPADVYDTLELSAWVFGGIGAGSGYAADGCPLCLYGHLDMATDGNDYSNVVRQVWATGLDSIQNDEAVQSINQEHGAALNGRVPFAHWCRRLNVVRGAA